MQKLEIEVSDDLARALEPYQARMPDLLLLGLRQLRVTEALALYGRGVISFGRAVELAGVSRDDLIRQAHEAGIKPSWDEEMVRQELP